MNRLTRRSLLGAGGLLAASTLVGTRSKAQASPAPPPPWGDRPGGEALAQGLEGLGDAQRYEAFADQFLAGNVPGFLRLLTPVELVAPAGHVGAQRATVYVSPDYLAVGTNEDHLRVPLDLPQAARVARSLGMALPTPRIVDAVYAAASTVLAPSPLPPTSQMRSLPYVVRHNMLVERARAGRSVLPLIAGHKKDLVLTKRLRAQPDRVAIYGWHRPDGRPIQPLSLVHGKGYADYSHGVRLIARYTVVDGVQVDLFEAMADPAMAALFSDEGCVEDADGLMG